MPPSKASCPDDDEQLRAFRACPVLKPEPFEAWLPDVMWAAHMLADTLAVCWEWGLLALLTVASGLVPEDRFEPAPSISIPSSLWVVLLHPGRNQQLRSRASHRNIRGNYVRLAVCL